MSIEAMKQALAALETCRIRSVSEWEVSDVTPKNVTAAISALRNAIQQAEAQQPATGEPVYWEWRHLSSHPDTVDFGQWSEWKRVEARSAIHTIDDALAEFRAYIAQGYKYELRPLYTHPAPSGLGDSKRLDYLQDRGATIDLIAGVADFYPMRFRVGGLHSSANIDVRAAIDAAMLAAKAQKGQG